MPKRYNAEKVARYVGKYWGKIMEGRIIQKVAEHYPHKDKLTEFKMVVVMYQVYKESSSMRPAERSVREEYSVSSVATMLGSIFYEQMRDRFVEEKDRMFPGVQFLPDNQMELVIASTFERRVREISKKEKMRRGVHVPSNRFDRDARSRLKFK